MSPSVIGDLSVFQFLFHVFEVLLLFKIVTFLVNWPFLLSLCNLFPADNTPCSDVYFVS